MGILSAQVSMRSFPTDPATLDNGIGGSGRIDATWEGHPRFGRFLGRSGPVGNHRTISSLFPGGSGEPGGGSGPRIW
jgi:hypothetical protein